MKHLFVFLACLSALWIPAQSFAQDSQTTDPQLLARKAYIKNLEDNPSPEGLARRDASNAILKSQSVSTNSTLPVLPKASETTRRTTEQVAKRALALITVAAKGDGAPADFTGDLIHKFKLTPVFTPEEARYIATTSSDEHADIQFFWRYEAFSTLLWALGYIDTLPPPTEPQSVERGYELVMNGDLETFIGQAKLRPQSEILDEADKIYRYHWAIRQRDYDDTVTAPDMSFDVIIERHHTLNWLFGYADAPWDDVPTDT